MDIVTRLKNLIDLEGLSISQFADKAGIPRPTLSQILNGRNKTISNEIIGKLHNAFPDLNIVWLLFGDGEVYTAKNIQFSEAENTQNTGADSPKNTAPQPETNLFSFDEIDIKKGLEKSDPYSMAESDYRNAQKSTMMNSTMNNTAATIFNKQISDEHPEMPNRTFSDSVKRKVISIMVFYSDNSFETFSPSES